MNETTTRRTWLGALLIPAVCAALYACSDGGSTSSSTSGGDDASAGDATTSNTDGSAAQDSGGTDSGGGADAGSQDASKADGSITDGSVADADAGTADAAPACFVPYGCTTYVCSPGDAGLDASVALSAAGATNASGPRAGIDGGVDAGAGAGVSEAFAFTTAGYLTGTDPKAALPLGANDRTISLWVKDSTTGSSQTFFNYGTFATAQRAGILNSGGNEYFVGENRDLAGTKNVADGAWHHVAATYTNNTITLFVDGAQDTTGNPSSALNTVSQAFAIGQTVGSPAREPFQGTISDIRVYNRVLTGAEITSLSSFTAVGANPEVLRKTSAGLVFWLPLFKSDPSVMLNRCGP